MNPYENLPDQAFWRPAVADQHPLQISGLWSPKFSIGPADKISTAGSCFAQHISAALKERGYHWLNGEPAPPYLSEEGKKEFNYDIFSFRTGNIYTAELLQQWIEWAFESRPVPDEYWEQEGRVYDPFRPNIEPRGFASREELRASREATLQAIRKVVQQSSVFVFTLGLTEAWKNKSGNYVYPMCPGTVAGNFSPDVHEFVNFRYPQIRAALTKTIRLMRRHNETLRVLLTVSPVPLTATASAQHVLSATSYSKSTLRAVAGDVAADMSLVDYFPSFEMITSFPFRGMFFEPNLRSVAPVGVQFVMNSFFTSLGDDRRAGDLSHRFSGAEESEIQQERRAAALKKREKHPRKNRRTEKGTRSRAESEVCEDILLDAFSPKKNP